MPIELEPLSSVSTKIKNTRRTLGLSQKRLAIMTGLSQSTIARIESDIESLNPSYRTVFTVIDALNSANHADKAGELLNRKAGEIMHSSIIYARPDDTIARAIETVRKGDFMQLPVLSRSRNVLGTVYQKDLLDVAANNPRAIGSMRVSSILKPALPQVDKGTALAKLKPIIESWNAVLVVEKNRAVGIITIYDLMKLL